MLDRRGLGRRQGDTVLDERDHHHHWWQHGVLVEPAEHARALSSGESEYYAATTGAADLLHLIEVMKFFGVDARGRLQTDSSACIGMASRKGVGRVRHLETRALWLQDVIDSECIGIKDSR